MTTIKVTEEMRQAGLRELQGMPTDEDLAAMQHQVEVESFEVFEFPGQVRPDWDEISEGLEQRLTTKTEVSQ